jgi:hypothetical protein
MMLDNVPQETVDCGKCKRRDVCRMVSDYPLVCEYYWGPDDPRTYWGDRHAH